MDQIKERFNDMKVGRTVAYKTPCADEVYKNGHPVVYIIKEDNGDRVLMETVWTSLPIRPLYVELKSELRIAFNQHTDVPVPDFINFDEWTDNSWENDETASVILEINSQYNLRLWIYSDEYIEEMMKMYPIGHEWHNSITKYTLCLEDDDGHMTMGRHCTDDNILQTIEEFKNNWQTLIETEEWS